MFRVAAGPRVGFGHLMRARALARALGVRPIVSIRGGGAAARTARSLGCVLLADRPGAFDRADVLVVDDPSAVHRDAWIGRAAGRGIAAVAVVDGGARSSTASLTVDGSLASGARHVPRVLAGTRFYILDSRIAAARRKPIVERASRSPRRVLVALGGGTHVLSAAGRVVSALRARCPDAAVDVAAGFVAARRRTLAGARWLVRRRGLMGALLSADVAVLAGGVTLYEACALGVPAVGLAVVPGQRRAIRAFAASGALVDAGGPRLDRAALDRMASGVEQLLADHARRRLTSRRARQLVDAGGAARVAREICRLVRQHGGRVRG